MCDEAGAFSTISDGDIDRMLLLARSGGCVDSLPRLPWETGVMACIFGDGALPRPILQQPRAPLPEDPSTTVSEELPVPRTRAAPDTLFERSFSASADISD